VIVHGYGETDVAGRTSYYDLRSRFTGLGIATLSWDKPGCGASEGTFDANQPVESSAREVLDAIRRVRESGLPGSQKIGLWGISRAGWIAPLAITQDPDIAFWISVSGTDDKENFPYLLESNLRIEGRSEAEIHRLLGELRRGFEITSRGGSFEDYRTATQNLRRDPFMLFVSGGADENEAAFRAQQAQFLSGAFQVDEATGLQIYVPQFAQLLTRVNVPVLALFGEKDRNVNWRNTVALYTRTIGENPNAGLTIRTFPDGNHNLQQAQTGGLREVIEMTERRPSEGYFEAMEEWLRANVLN
jgi:pimeloyl-ACP methyl ester carboxylesterase